jgi:L-threonylcarbamoyladenylate synthase
MQPGSDAAGPEEIAHAVKVLRAGGLVAFPTETVYGLGADCFDQKGVERVFALKGRPASNPLIVHVSGPEMAGSLVARWTPQADLLARAFWPGPLSIVLPKSGRVPAIVTGGGPNVAVRSPAHLVTLALLEAFGSPLVGPSANPSGRVSPTRAAHVRESFAEADVYVLDGGPCRAGIESTVVTLAEASPRILRPGVIGAEELSRALGVAVAPPGPAGREAPHPDSPGQLPTHYAPRAKTVMVDNDRLPALFAGAGGPVVLIAQGSPTVPHPHRLIAMPADASGYAAALYAALRDADAASPTLIAVLRPPTGGPVWDAVADRLARACAS